MLVGALLMVLLSTTALAVLWRSRADALATWEQYLGSFSAAVAGHATQTLQSADAVLKNVMEQVKVHGPDSEEALRRLSISTPFQDLLRDRAARYPAVGFVAVADVEGRILSASLPMPTLDEPSQMRVRAFIADPAPDVDLLIPPRGCTAGSEAFCLVRKIRTASGRMIGLAVAGIETRHFKRFYRSVSLGDTDSAILLLSRDASLLARHPPRPEALGLPYGGEPSVQTAAKAWAEGRSTAVVRTHESAHGTPQMSAVYAVTGFPLMASVLASDSLVLTSWRRVAWFVGVGTVLVDLLIAAMALHVHRLKVQRSTALRQLDAARAETKSASQAKSRFLSTMSHELRTPLNAVIGFSDVLAQTPLPGKAREHVVHIQQAGKQLLALIEDVLDFAQIEDGEVQLQQAPFELGALLQAACDETQPQAAAKGLALRLDLAPDLPGQVIGDALRLKQVLVHLLSNAVKFTPVGSVTLAATASPHEGMHTTLRLEVKDSGIGIAPEVQAHIFDAFTQLDGTPTRRFGGAGLGLSIVQRLVTMMGGYLELTSTPGQGSTFSVSLPLETAGRAH